MLKGVLILVAVILLLPLLLAFIGGFRKAHRDSKRNAQLAYTDPDHSYLGLRNQVFNGSMATEILPADFPANDPWAVVMDWGVQRAVATVVAFNDGAASMYYSSGGGNIGGGQGDASIRVAARNALTVASRHMSQLKLVTEFPIPTHQGQVFFYVLTRSAVYFGEGSQKGLGANQHQLSELGNAMQAIVTGYRLHQAKHA